jgi:hypothetical protein
MSDRDRLTDLIEGKRREIGDFVLATAVDVMSADMNEADKGQVALSLLGLVTKARPAPVTIEHAPAPKQIEKPRPVVSPYIAKRVAGIMETGILPEPAAPLVPETDMRAPPVIPEAEAIVEAIAAPAPVAKRETLYSRIAAALAKHGNNRTLAAEEVGCDKRRVHNYCHLHDIKMPDGTDARRRKKMLSAPIPAAIMKPDRPVKPIPAAGMMPDRPVRVYAADVKHPQYQKPPASVAPKERKCMTCTEPFMSEGPHNRMCPKCRHLSEGIAA